MIDFDAPMTEIDNLCFNWHESTNIAENIWRNKLYKVRSRLRVVDHESVPAEAQSRHTGEGCQPEKQWRRWYKKAVHSNYSASCN